MDSEADLPRQTGKTLAQLRSGWTHLTKYTHDANTTTTKHTK